MLEIKSFFGDWKQATKEQAENFYRHFYKTSTAIKAEDRRKYFNMHHIKGGHILRGGTAETTEELNNRLFNFYKNDLLKLAGSDKQLRFICIEYICDYPSIDPYKMAASILKDDIGIVFDDSTITRNENDRKFKKVLKMMEEEK